MREECVKGFMGKGLHIDEDALEWSRADHSTYALEIFEERHIDSSQVFCACTLFT